jgi:hypothetical protein
MRTVGCDRPGSGNRNPNKGKAQSPPAARRGLSRIPGQCWSRNERLNQLLYSDIVQERMVGIAQLVERQIVVLDVTGSSPVTHPEYNLKPNRKLR